MFNSRLEAILGTNICCSEMKILGLIMYRGIRKNDSKTEDVYFPSRSKIKQCIKIMNKVWLIIMIVYPYLILHVKKRKYLWRKWKILNKKPKNIWRHSTYWFRKKWIYIYIYISFTKNFKYLGSWVWPLWFIWYLF